MNGVDQALPFQAQSLLQSVNIGNLSFVVGFDATWPHIVSASDQGWLVDGTHGWGSPFEQGGTLYQENASSCPDDGFLTAPPQSNNNNWSWDLSIRPKHRIPSIEGNESLHLKLSADTYVYCNQEDGLASKFTVQEGPDLILYQNNQTLRLWDDQCLLKHHNWRSLSTTAMIWTSFCVTTLLVMPVGPDNVTKFPLQWLE